MSRLDLGGKTPRCPLCVSNDHHPEHFMERKFEPNRGFFIFVCDNYKVSVRVDDPFVGRWEEAAAKAGRVECPACNADMRYFATSTGFMKAVCPKKSCGATLHNAEPKEDREAFQREITLPENPGLLQ